uniref:HMG box domain-containing protein n=1 Tax=Timema douglasi TaxID=61478 RepID=A0A7R8Z8F0_TIMDO|nr:unnamed protein product [Timema douglasi]
MASSPATVLRCRGLRALTITDRCKETGFHRVTFQCHKCSWIWVLLNRKTCNIRARAETFHTPSFGDEEFDIPPINPHQHQQGGNQHVQNNMNSYQQSQMLQNQSPDNMVMSDSSGYQQPLYLSGPPEHSMGISVSSSYNSPQPTYTMASPNQPNNSQLLMMQQQQQHQQMMLNHGQSMGQYGRSPQGNSPPTGQEGTTTSEDSDDSTPHSAMRMGWMDENVFIKWFTELFLTSIPPKEQRKKKVVLLFDGVIFYISYDLVKIAQENYVVLIKFPPNMVGMKRPSPEPADNSLAKIQKKPKVQKKKKKRDPNEPQKPVSAYALFFRDTQAAIKGQNPNASFGEVSKIVASMWDALDAEHKNVYKKKTEAAKKEYLKALAAYRASLVSKGASEGEGMYSGYGGFGGGYSGYSPPTALPSPPMLPPPSQQQQQQQMGPGNGMAKKSPLLSSMMTERGNGQPQQGLMGQMQQTHLQPQVNQGGYMQQQMSPPRSEHIVSSPPPVSAGGTGPLQPQNQQPPPRPGNACIRHGCPNAAISNSEWEDEYCSNECVVSHCRCIQFLGGLQPKPDSELLYGEVRHLHNMVSAPH